MTRMMDIKEFERDLKSAILARKKEETYKLLQYLSEAVRTDTIYVQWITQPVVLTEVKQMLIDNLSVIPRAMQVSSRLRSAPQVQKAIVFCMALENGVKHIL